MRVRMANADGTAVGMVVDEVMGGGMVHGLGAGHARPPGGLPSVPCCIRSSRDVQRDCHGEEETPESHGGVLAFGVAGCGGESADSSAAEATPPSPPTSPPPPASTDGWTCGSDVYEETMEDFCEEPGLTVQLVSTLEKLGQVDRAQRRPALRDVANKLHRRLHEP
jgi:hypothetical protein